MKCKQCLADGVKSRVYPRGGSVTAMPDWPFYDEDGRLHNHDRNIRTERYECSNGHAWTDESLAPCWCGWPDEVVSDERADQ